ncbi:MAG: hypothetical protein C9356_04665 [Oleiphilus sp.]|nr:MAG: hypothetical protein C9356_04665 [Oleiphilus sp.]
MRFLMLILALTLSTTSLAEEAPAEVKALASELATWGDDPVLIAAVKEQNGKGITLDAIKARDAEWRKVEGLDDQMKAMMESPAAKRMLELESSKGFLFEMFLMDNQGANVAMTNKTSDYWQGDEAKWQKSFNGGKGGIHVGEVEFDDSAQAYLVQVSVSVNEGGKAIGAMTIGVNLDDM